MIFEQYVHIQSQFNLLAYICPFQFHRHDAQIASSLSALFDHNSNRQQSQQTADVNQSTSSRCFKYTFFGTVHKMRARSRQMQSHTSNNAWVFNNKMKTERERQDEKEKKEHTKEYNMNIITIYVKNDVV